LNRVTPATGEYHGKDHEDPEKEKRRKTKHKQEYKEYGLPPPSKPTKRVRVRQASFPQEGEDHPAAMGMGAVFPQKNPLPGPQAERAPGKGKGF
jgi:hypothetical protein